MNRLVPLLTFCAAVCVLVPASAATQPATPNDHLTVTQWVNPATPGELVGRVFMPLADSSAEPIANAVVVMANQGGERFRGVSDETGRFMISGIRPGVYALTARSKGLFACYAMHVVDGNMAGANKLPSEVDIAAAAVDYSVVRSLALRYLPPTYDENLYTIDDADLTGIADRVAGGSLFRVRRSEGGFKGQLRVAGAHGSTLKDAGLLSVFLFHQGEIIRRVVSAPDGTFAFDDVAAGEYSILAMGQSGLGMVGLELIDESIATQATVRVKDQSGIAENQLTLTSMMQSEQGFVMQVAPLPQALEAEIYQEPLTDEFGNPISELGPGGLSGGSVGGGGMSGGGGGGGGLGGGGAMIGLAGLAGLAALGGNDDDPIIVPPDAISPDMP